MAAPGLDAPSTPSARKVNCTRRWQTDVGGQRSPVGIIRRVRVSLVLTVLNEGESLHPLLESLCAQTRPPDEVVVADGGSTDHTLPVLREYAERLNLRVVEAPGSNISQGRNAAIRAASGEIIAVTDAGVVCAADWLERLTAPFHPPSPDVLVVGRGAGGEGLGVRAVAGFFESAPHTLFELAMGATVLPQASEIVTARYYPSSRSVAFLKSAWEAAGGYPEWLDFSEDVVFDRALMERFGPFRFAPEARVRFRPRTSLSQFFRQYYQYARGDGKAGLFTRIHFIRYFTYVVALPMGIYAALTVSLWLWLLGALAGLAYVRRPLLRLRGQLRGRTLLEKLYVLALIPVIRVTGDAAKMLGWPVGVGWRITRGARQ